MGFMAWWAKEYMNIHKKVEEASNFVGEVGGDIVSGVGTFVSDIADGIGLDGTAEVIKDITTTTSTGIKGAGKIVGATNTAIARGTIELIGEVTDDDELRMISFDNEPDSDVIEEIEKIIDGNKDFIDKYSGAAEFQKLQQMYHCDYIKITNSYKQAINKTFDDIESYVKVINKQRDKSAVYFTEFENVSSLIAEWSVEKYRFKEIPKLKLIVPDKSKDSIIFKDVNYDEHPIWMRIKGLCGGNKDELEEAKTKIKESLNEIENKCKLESMRWTKISENLKFIQESFVNFNDLYIRSINELRYSIELVQNTVFQKNIFFFSQRTKINPYFFPQKHLHCLMACDRLSRLLCEMSKRTYLDNKSEIILKDIELIKDNQEWICKSEKAA